MNLFHRADAPGRLHRGLRQASLPFLLALTLSGVAHAQSTDTGNQATTPSNDGSQAKPHTLQAVQVQGTTSPTYSGGDIARSGNLGVLGEQDLMDVPFAMTSYTEDYIANHQAYTIADVVANDPAVRVGDGYGNFAELFVLRGFPLDGDDITFDGLYGIIPRQLVDAGDIGRLDVLRGASAFLYGVSPAGSGIGGSINVEPKWALDSPLTRATVDYGSDAQAGAQIDFSRRFGKDDRYGIRINLGGRDGDTSIDRESRRSNYQSIAFDYRGDITVTRKDGSQVTGYLFDRRTGTSLADSAVRIIPSTDGVQYWPFSFE